MVDMRSKGIFLIKSNKNIFEILSMSTLQCFQGPHVLRRSCRSCPAFFVVEGQVWVDFSTTFFQLTQMSLESLGLRFEQSHGIQEQFVALKLASALDAENEMIPNPS